MQRQQHLLSSRNCLLGKIWLTRYQIVLPFLPGCFALSNPLFFADKAWFHCHFISFLPLSDATGRRAPTLQWGSSAMAAVYPTVTIHPSDEDNNVCPQALNWKWLYTYINTFLSSQDAFNIQTILCYCMLCHIMLCCVYVSLCCVVLFYVTFKGA